MVSAFHFAACLPLDLVIRLSIATSLCNFLSPLKLAVAAGLLSKKFIFSVTLTEHSYTSSGCTDCSSSSNQFHTTSKFTWYSRVRSLNHSLYPLTVELNRHLLQQLSQMIHL
ncbi:hypothetical protein SORBI_3007G178700 [Sorghum bicolor]|uniref:Uncharacterized protein n=1 Tax=Sorghum bicolor TaxID=4558 RepID=C5YH34_SORBI|nr:hypothetical protein SORBI_3007G178700 [Sorghum bicolor]